MRSKAADEKIKTMLKKYSTPENCKNLIPPKTNLAIWKSLGPNTKKVDVALQRSQKLLCIVLLSVSLFNGQINKQE